MSRLSFIAECVKNVDPRYFEPRHLSHDPKWYDHYQEFVIDLKANEIDHDEFEVCGVSEKDEIDGFGKNINDTILYCSEVIEEIAHDLSEEDDDLDWESLEFGLDAIEIDESRRYEGVIGSIKIVIGMERKCYEIRGDHVGKQYRHEGHENPFRL